MAFETKYSGRRHGQERCWNWRSCFGAFLLLAWNVLSVNGFAILPLQPTIRSLHLNQQTTPLPLTRAAASSSTVVDEQQHQQQEQPNENDDDDDVVLSIWEQAAKWFVSDDYATNPNELKKYVQYVTLLRVGVPGLLAGMTAGFVYPALSLTLAAMIDDYDVFNVVANDSSQYIQNILTTCGLTFSILVGQTYYFMYQQQEAIYYALFEEVTVAKSLLEQVALVCQGRKAMYQQILNCIDVYVRQDLMQLAADPATLLSARPIDDPFERIMFLTSVGEPSIVYQTVRSLRQARAKRLGALQQKLPPIHMVLLWSLAGIVLCTFPVLGAGVQTLGGLGILKVQSWYLSFIVFGITLTLGIVNELRQPAGRGAYNVVSVLDVMVGGLEEELQERMLGKYNIGNLQQNNLGPTVDATYSSFGTTSSVLMEQQQPSRDEEITMEDDSRLNDESSFGKQQWLSETEDAASSLSDNKMMESSSSLKHEVEGSSTSSSSSSVEDSAGDGEWFGKRIARRIIRKR